MTPMDHSPAAGQPQSRAIALAVQRGFERIIFASRWLLAPFYLGLAIGLLILLIKFIRQAVAMIIAAPSADAAQVTVGILSLIDMSLLANLLLMVILAGYESFVSRLDVGEARGRLEWMGRIGFSDLKLKLMASIVAISAIRLLEGFMNADKLSDRDLGWLVGIHFTFVLSGLFLALMDRLSGENNH